MLILLHLILILNAMLKLFDSNDFRRMALFNSDFSNLSVKFISNSICKDKKNMGNAIVEMITASELPIKEYNINNLGMYLEVYSTFEANYHNTILSEYEPLIERTKVKVLMYQVASFLRSKCLVDIDEMINCNISSNAVKALNLFMLKYSEDSEEIEIIKENIKKKIKKKVNQNKINKKANTLQISRLNTQRCTESFPNPQAQNPCAGFPWEWGPLPSRRAYA